MEGEQLIKLAQDYCKHYHNGQFRKGSNLPYQTHPLAVANILDRYGYSDYVTQCIALLHDVVEDTEVITGEIKERFGFEISNGVFVLSKNTIYADIVNYIDQALSFDESADPKDQLYKLRLSFARRKVQRVKIADMIHNTQDLVSLEPEGIERKINDAEKFYIPLGRKVAPLMINELELNLENYKALAERLAV